MAKYEICVTVKKTVEIPSVAEIKAEDVPKPYTVEEWAEQLQYAEAVEIAGNDDRDLDHWWIEPIEDNTN